MKKTTLTLSLTAALFTLTGCFTPEDSILDWTASEARDKCHEWVADKLKSPSTAEFEDDSEYTTEKEMVRTSSTAPSILLENNTKLARHLHKQQHRGGPVQTMY